MPDPILTIAELSARIKSQPLFEGSSSFRLLHSSLCEAISSIRLDALPADRRPAFARVAKRIREVHARQNDTFLQKDLDVLRDILHAYRLNKQRDSRLIAMLLAAVRGEPVETEHYSGQDILFHRRLVVEEGLAIGQPISNGEYITDWDITETTAKGAAFMDAYRQQEPAPGQITVFVSHSSRDSALAQALVDVLRAALNLPAQCIRCTSLDGYRLPGGVNTDARLRDELIGCKSFVGLMTPASMQSTYVLFELGARWGKGLHLLPIAAKGLTASDLGGPLRGINVIPLDSIANAHQVVDELAGTLGVTTQPVGSFVRHLQALVDSAGHVTTAADAG